MDVKDINSDDTVAKAIESKVETTLPNLFSVPPEMEGCVTRLTAFCDEQHSCCSSDRGVNKLLPSRTDSQTHRTGGEEEKNLYKEIQQVTASESDDDINKKVLRVLFMCST